MDMDAPIQPDRSELNLLHDDEIERLLALEIACACLLDHAERREAARSTEPALLRAA
jgi:hypothetical protein